MVAGVAPINGRKTPSMPSHSACAVRPESGPLSPSRRSLGSGAGGACGRQLHPGTLRQTFPAGEGMCAPIVAGTAARTGMADRDALQHAGRHPPEAGIDAHAADASTVTSDEPTSAPRAIHERRSFVKVIGMVLSRTAFSSLQIRLDFVSYAIRPSRTS
jgi:hypothetical protein